LAGAFKIEKRTITVGGYPVHYKVVGRGEPAILVHGLSASTFWWNRNIPALASRYTLYLVDLPGFGAMRRSRQRLVLSQAASWLLSWMQAVGISQAHLIGHSMGGCICIRLAARHPEVVRRLVLFAPAGVPTGRSLAGYLIPLLVAIRYTTFRFLPILFYDGLRAGLLTILRATQDLLTQDVREDLPSITAPTLLIWGECDPLVPPVFANIVHKAITNSHLLLVKRAGHIVMYDQAQVCNEAMLAFLAGTTNPHP